MANVVNPGYMGWADFGGAKFRFDSCSVAAKQEVNAPDLITGFYRRMAYNMGPVDISGSISGPVTEGFSTAGTGLWVKATERDTCGLLTPGTLSIHYYCASDGGKSDFSWPTAKVNSIQFSCAAGDVATFSADMVAAGVTTPTSEVGQLTTDPGLEKLLTWDKVSLSVTTDDGHNGTNTWGSPFFSNFDVTFANNVEVKYALGTGNLYPFALVEGLTTITGSLSAYNIPEMFGSDTYDEYNATGLGEISFNVGSGVQTLKVRWHRVEPAASVGAIISTIAFTGLGPQFGEA